LLRHNDLRMHGLNRSAGGLGHVVNHLGAGDLGDGVAIVNLNGNLLNLGIVNTVLGHNLVTGVGDGVLLRHGDGGDHWQDRSMGRDGRVNECVGLVEACLGLSSCLTLPVMAMNGWNRWRAIADCALYILTQLAELDLLCGHGVVEADCLGCGGAGLGHHLLLLDHTV
jgi:hypothetical protein